MGPVPTNQAVVLRLRSPLSRKRECRKTRTARFGMTEKRPEQCVRFVEIRLAVIRWPVLPRGDGFSGI